MAWLCRALERSCLYTLPNGRVSKRFSAFPFTRTPATHCSRRPSRGRSEVLWIYRTDTRRAASQKAANREQKRRGASCLSVTISLVSGKISVLVLDDRAPRNCTPCASPGRSRRRPFCPSDIHRCCWSLLRPANLASMSGAMLEAEPPDAHPSRSAVWCGTRAGG